jgi:hypothetical protein
MKKVVLPFSIHLFATATDRCVFPDPLGPVNISQPFGFSEYSIEAEIAV